MTRFPPMTDQKLMAMPYDEVKTLIGDLNSEMVGLNRQNTQAHADGISSVPPTEGWRAYRDRIKYLKCRVEAELGRRHRENIAKGVSGRDFSNEIATLAAFLLADRVLDGDSMKEAAKECVALAKECYGAVWEAAKGEVR
ncbi:hypothetical protein UFOVP75_216 [uncultured Caudovirales phage]|uniref:Uncharacterized protein n=1 Tax=uncultured Caudovirales phage TaxID=2100421 RepID=A0A6J5L2M1_9CAUD|nr:hypothetical protein UFOVP75_216 [uncultured Caudovirales phage]